MTLKLPQLYAITDVAIAGRSHLEQVKLLVDAGIKLIQLREKRSPPHDFYPDALAAAEYCRRYGVKCIINDRVDIALAVSADGVHLGQDDMPAAAARKLLGKEAIVGLSTHTMAQVRNALAQEVDYIGFGPVFRTTTKSRPDPATGLEMLRQASDAAGQIPIVAIGGITRSNAKDVLSSGAASIAVISGLVGHSDGIGQAVREFSAAVET